MLTRALKESIRARKITRRPWIEEIERRGRRIRRVRRAVRLRPPSRSIASQAVQTIIKSSLFQFSRRYVLGPITKPYPPILRRHSAVYIYRKISSSSSSSLFYFYNLGSSIDSVIVLARITKIIKVSNHELETIF